MKATSPRVQCTVVVEQARIGSYELRFRYHFPQMWRWFQSSIPECKEAFTNKRGVFWGLKRKKTLCRAEGVPATESECDGRYNFRNIFLKLEIKKKIKNLLRILTISKTYINRAFQKVGATFDPSCTQVQNIVFGIFFFKMYSVFKRITFLGPFKFPCLVANLAIFFYIDIYNLTSTYNTKKV